MNPVLNIIAQASLIAAQHSAEFQDRNAVSSKVQSLHLHCEGEADHRIVAVEVIIIQATKHEKFTDSMDIDLDDEGGTATIPRRLLGNIEAKKSKFSITSLKMNDENISGKISINWLNHPNFNIDRKTGILSMSGEIGNFTGICSKYDPAHRAF